MLKPLAHTLCVFLCWFLASGLATAGSEEFEVSTSHGDLQGTISTTPILVGEVVVAQKLESSISLKESPGAYTSSITVHNSDNLDVTVDFGSAGTVTYFLDPARWVVTKAGGAVTDCTTLTNTDLFKAVDEVSAVSAGIVGNSTLTVKVMSFVQRIECDPAIDTTVPTEANCPCYWTSACTDFCTPGEIAQSIRAHDEGGLGYAVGCFLAQAMENHGAGRSIWESCDEPEEPETCSTTADCPSGHCCPAAPLNQCTPCGSNCQYDWQCFPGDCCDEASHQCRSCADECVFSCNAGFCCVDGWCTLCD